MLSELGLALALVIGGAPLDGARPECPPGTRPANWHGRPYTAEGCETFDGIPHGRVLMWDPTRSRLLSEGQYDHGKRVGRWRWDAASPAEMSGWAEYQAGHPVRSAQFWSNGARFKESEGVVVNDKSVRLREKTWRMNGSPSSEFECLEVDRARARCARLRRVQWKLDGSIEEFVGTWEENQQRALEERRAAAAKQPR